MSPVLRDHGFCSAFFVFMAGVDTVQWCGGLQNILGRDGRSTEVTVFGVS
jgi:hypothetical protein